MNPLFRTAVGLAVILLGVRQTHAQSCFFDANCADGNLCNGIERCVGGACQPGPALQCDDGDPCTVDSCDPNAGCVHHDTACPTTCGAGDDGQRCSDGSACTVGDTCSAGTCVGTPLACDDGDPCTTDSCDAALGCVYVEEAHPPTCVSDCVQVADHTPCPGDGDPCTQDGCLEGRCQIGLRQFVRQCDDGDRCNGDEFCSAVKGCQPGPAPACEDGDLCNGVETCDSATGCQPGAAVPDGTACDDGRVCTLDDTCSAGACGGTADSCDDVDASTTDVCTEASGCVHCTAMSAAKLTLTFPVTPSPGKLTLKGAYLAPVALDPTTPAGVDVLLHDGSVVFYAAHVPPTAFVASASGSVEKFRDSTGTLANGLTKLQLKAGTPTKTSKASAKGRPAGTAFGGDASTELTIVTGPACATATLPCTLVHGGRARRCQFPPH